MWYHESDPKCRGGRPYVVARAIDMLSVKPHEPFNQSLHKQRQHRLSPGGQAHRHSLPGKRIAPFNISKHSTGKPHDQRTETTEPVLILNFPSVPTPVSIPGWLQEVSLPDFDDRFLTVFESTTIHHPR